MTDAATRRQVQAARPSASTWLTANAGSGKTKVLTDRVARLLLAGSLPQNILCLTFTKAAASEMQNRLFARLGEWAMAGEAELRDRLVALGLDDAPGPGELSCARTLFARAVETPGGLKIQTIHSFCASVLRRFPLEAGVPPNFAEMDERAGDALLWQIMGEIAEEEPEALRAVAPYLTFEGPEALMREVAGARTAFAPPMDRSAICEALGLESTLTEEKAASGAFSGAEADFIPPLVEALAAGLTSDQGLADKLAALGAPAGAQDVERFAAALLTQKGTIPKTPPTKAIKEAAPELADALNGFRERLRAARDRVNLVRTADRSAALHQFAGTFLDRYAGAKAERGWLDFDDLILKTRDLLSVPGLADWVLYKLDRGIDHILVDEAQDTSPAQWEVIRLLAEEIAAGSGRAEAGRRTLFVVGDRKQSIYSFQGADPREFDRMQARFSTALSPTSGIQTLEMEFSFRSAPPILRTVDAALSGLDGLGEQVSHIPFHDTMPGRVDLWPLARAEDGADDVPWYDPVDRVLPTDGESILARELAIYLKRLIDARTPIENQKGQLSALDEGDILILFRTRNRLFDAVIGACKAVGLAIAGTDRMKLAAELAVRDICAFLRFLATPEDDLSLAAVLRSPLLGWSEDDLYRLAQPRSGYLWQALRQREDVPDTLATLRDMRDHAEFLRPYELIQRLLIRHCGRARLLARIGSEAEDGIDVLLDQALAYETTEAPSLTGFLDWLSAEDIAVKRQADQAVGKIRVMTVHGAKGLESPVVILPDTLRRGRGPEDKLLFDAEGRAFWRPRAGDRPCALDDAAELARAKDLAEEERLLYVAMTRAESWLIVAGATKADDAPKGSWYRTIVEALPGVAAGPVETPLGPGLRVERGPWPTAAPGTAPIETVAPATPGWLDAHLPRPAVRSPAVLPSDLGGAKALPGEGLSSEAAMARGTGLHELLEHLPDVPRQDRGEAAASLLPDMPPEMYSELLTEAAGILDAPALAPLFLPGTLAEVPVAARLDVLGGRRIQGVVDRLVLTDDTVLVVDYKSNRVLPESVRETPEGLLRQMGAYGAALSQIYPDRTVSTAILWTRAPRLDRLPPDLVAAALARAEVP